jgi:hypothetical protein
MNVCAEEVAVKDDVSGECPPGEGARR